MKLTNWIISEENKKKDCIFSLPFRGLAQQHESFFFFSERSLPTLILVLPPVGGNLVLLSEVFWTLLLISVARVMKAVSTLFELRAEVSMNLIPRESASSLPSSKVTCLLLSRSALFPTRSLITFSFAFLSASASQLSMSLNVYLSVIS